MLWKTMFVFFLLLPKFVFYDVEKGESRKVWWCKKKKRLKICLCWCVSFSSSLCRCFVAFRSEFIRLFTACWAMLAASVTSDAFSCLEPSFRPKETSAIQLWFHFQTMPLSAFIETHSENLNFSYLLAICFVHKRLHYIHIYSFSIRTYEENNIEKIAMCT